MSGNSIQEIIGGADNGGGIPQQEDEDRAELAGGGGANVQDTLWLQDLELGNNIYGIVSLVKTGLMLIVWFLYYWNGTSLKSYYWWTWFSAFLTVMISWFPVAVSYLMMLNGGSETADTLFFYTSQISIIGPMFFYFAPLVVLVLAYNERKETGLQFSSKTHFWLGWMFAVWVTILSIIFEFAFLPGIRVWYELKYNQDKYKSTEQEVVDPNAGPAEEEEEEEPII